MATNRPCFIGLTVRNYNECVRFYRDALGIPLKHGEDYEHHECSWHKPYIHFAIFPAPSDQAGLSFWVDDLEEAHKRAVEAGARVLHAPRDFPWGRTAEYLDPEGNRVSLVEGPTRT